jgi:CRISPR-associated protein Cmr1
VNDLNLPIRAPEVRGQLRFWWRAIRGGQPEFEGRLEKMKAREDEIWGAASTTPGREKTGEKKDTARVWQEPVQICIDIIKPGASIDLFEIEERQKRGKNVFTANFRDLSPDYDPFLAYIAFALQPSRRELDAAQTREDIVLKRLLGGVVFSLTLSFPAMWLAEIEAALWAWETFGGVGARTRRGFGTMLLRKKDGKEIEAEQLPPARPPDASTWLRERILHYAGDGEYSQEQIPHIDTKTRLRMSGPSRHATAVWKQLIDALRKFRQGPDRAVWPEARELRRILHTDTQGNGPAGTFPRAAFGLPIVFHLAHEHPATTITLQGKEDGKERRASRLILKPLPCRREQFLGLALIIDGAAWPEGDLVLLNEQGVLQQTISHAQIEVPAGASSALSGLIGQETDILQAFLDTLK